MSAATPPALDPAVVFAVGQGEIGLTRLDLRGFANPLWLRAGTSDAAACVAAFSSAAPVSCIRHNPRRILELGAGAGFRSVALARAFPDAEILAVATDVAAGRVALLNILPYRNIDLAVLGPRGADALATLLGRRGWTAYDVVITTAAEMPPLASWPDSVRLIAVQDPTPEAAPPAGIFAARMEAEYQLFYRLVSADLPPPPPQPLFDPATSRSVPAEFAIDCAGARALRTSLRAGASAAQVTIRFTAEADPAQLLAEAMLQAGQTLEIEAELPPCFGPCRIDYETAASAGNRAAAAEVLNAVLV